MNEFSGTTVGINFAFRYENPQKGRLQHAYEMFSKKLIVDAISYAFLN